MTGCLHAKPKLATIAKPKGETRGSDELRKAGIKMVDVLPGKDFNLQDIIATSPNHHVQVMVDGPATPIGQVVEIYAPHFVIPTGLKITYDTLLKENPSPSSDKRMGKSSSIKKGDILEGPIGETKSNHVAITIDSKVQWVFLGHCSVIGALTKEDQENECPVPAIAVELIKKYEGYAKKLPNGSAEAYPDPLPKKGWEVATIGWGNTKYPDGKTVQKGDVISPSDAEEFLIDHIASDTLPKLTKIPTWDRMNENQKGAIISFAYNLGSGFYGGANFASITRVCDSPDKWSDTEWVKAQFIKYRNPGSAVEKGLLIRREDEASVFCTPAKAEFKAAVSNTAKPAKANLPQKKTLKVMYFTQRDNAGQAHRTCNTASCWMGAMYMKPSLWEKCGKDTNADLNYYLKMVEKYGDTTDHTAQGKALNDLGVKSKWDTSVSMREVKEELAAGRPVVMGILHKGHVSSPSGGGHMILAVGYEPNGLIIHDPYGDLSLVGGGYRGSTDGAFKRYSYKNLGPRFEVDGPGTGWARLFIGSRGN